MRVIPPRALCYITLLAYSCGQSARGSAFRKMTCVGERLVILAFKVIGPRTHSMEDKNGPM
jgi:hypothetical protein